MIRSLYVPPIGSELRWYVMWTAAIVGIGRLGLAELMAPRAQVGIDLFYQPEWGVLFMGAAIGLWVTLSPQRAQSRAGQIIALLGIGLLVGLAYDVWPVFVSSARYLLAAAVLARELAR